MACCAFSLGRTPLQTYEVIIPEIDDTAFVDAFSARRAVFERMNSLDESLFDEFETLEVVVHDELGLKSTFRVTPNRVFRCQKVG